MKRPKKDDINAIIFANCIRAIRDLVDRTFNGYSREAAAQKVCPPMPKPPKSPASWSDSAAVEKFLKENDDYWKRFHEWCAVRWAYEFAINDNPARLLRMAADALEGKLQSDYDRELDDAYSKALREAYSSKGRLYPTFAETFPLAERKKVRRKSNKNGADYTDAESYKKVGKRPVTARSLRTTMTKRHGFIFHPDKRGAPKGPRAKNGTRNGH
jgi:hypothetical protein